jgi:hypothetical protein
MGVTSSPPLLAGKGPTARSVCSTLEADGLVARSPMFRCMIAGKVVKASEICTVWCDCKAMVVVFLLSFCIFEVSRSSGNVYRWISASAASNQLSLLTVMFLSLFEMKIENSFFCECG